MSSRRSLSSYFRLLTVFAKYSLAREMAFRGNFAMKVLLELVWLAILLIFSEHCFAELKQSRVGISTPFYFSSVVITLWKV